MLCCGVRQGFFVSCQHRPRPLGRPQNCNKPVAISPGNREFETEIEIIISVCSGH